MDSMVSVCVVDENVNHDVISPFWLVNQSFFDTSRRLVFNHAPMGACISVIAPMVPSLCLCL